MIVCVVNLANSPHYLSTDLPDLMKGSKDSDSGENGDAPTNNDDDDEDENMDIGGGGNGAAATR